MLLYIYWSPVQGTDGLLNEQNPFSQCVNCTRHVQNFIDFFDTNGLQNISKKSRPIIIFRISFAANLKSTLSELKCHEQ